MPTNYDDLIDDYLSGRSGREAEVRVQRLLETDEAFKESFELRRRTKDAFLQLEHQRLKERLQGLAKRDEGVGRVRPKRNLWIRWGAAAAVLILLPVIAFLLLPERFDRDDLIAQYSTPYPNVVLPVLREDNGEMDERMKAYAAYEEGDYQHAYTLFDDLRREGVDDDELPFYQGVTAFLLADYDTSVELLLGYSRTSEARLHRQAQWYLALSMLKSGDVAKAVKRLETLAATTGYRQAEARTLLAAF